MKILTLSVGFPGARRPFEEGVKLRFWDFLLLDNASAIPSANTYILAAWHPVYEQLLKLPGKIGVMWTSSTGEMDATPVEQAYLKRLLSDERISFIWFGDPSLAEVFPDKSFYAPYPLSASTVAPAVEKKDIATLFCPAKSTKNILNQLWAMKIVQKKIRLTLHTNIEGYDALLADISHVKHPWEPKEEYHRLLATAKVNLAASWAETFNYNVAEAGLLGTTSIISPTIPLPGVKVENPNSPEEIANKIVKTVAEPMDIRDRMEDFARRNNERIKTALTITPDTPKIIIR